MTTYAQHLNEARAYYRLCDEARALGIPTDLEDPDSPKTVDELRAAVAMTRAAGCVVCDDYGCEFCPADRKEQRS